MAAEGADVAIIDLKRIDQAKDVAGRHRARSVAASLVIKADVTSPDEMAGMAKQVVDELGSGRLPREQRGADVRPAHRNLGRVPGGQLHGRAQRVERRDPVPLGAGERFDREHLVDAAYPLPMPAQFMPDRRLAAAGLAPTGYGVTKWMLIYQTRFRWRRLLGVKNIRVNAVAPGVTMSPATKAVVPAGDHRHHHRVDRAALDARARGHDRRGACSSRPTTARR